jgi:hypothetical protein
MNGSFMGFGALLVGDAVLSARSLGPWATALLVVSATVSLVHIAGLYGVHVDGGWLLR